jgi:hypothetical protein
MSQPGDGRRDSSALHQQIKKGLQQVEPFINNSMTMQFQEQSAASSKSGSRDDAGKSSQTSPFRAAR